MELVRNFGALAVLEGRHFHIVGKRYTWAANVSPIPESVFAISENAADFAIKVDISHIPTNLGLYGVSSI